jgi:hypothetical protein
MGGFPVNGIFDLRPVDDDSPDAVILFHDDIHVRLLFLDI